MSINRIELQGTITRAQDYTTLKHNENNKGVVDQNNFQNQFHKAVDHKMNQVHKSEDTMQENKKFDAKDKGDGQYSGDGGKNRKQNSEEERRNDGTVAVKSMGRFDMKV